MSGLLPAKAPRLTFVDILRLVAGLQMINGHTLDALIRPEYAQGDFYHRYLWWRGLVSVAFIFTAGLAFHLATMARIDAHLADETAVRKRFLRGFELLAAGHLLRFSSGLFAGPPEQVEAAWAYFLRCGVLECIGLSLLTLQLLSVVIRRAGGVALASGAVALALVLLGPWTDAIEPSGAWYGLLSYVTHRGGSPFPWVPWGAYMFVGAAFGYLALPAGGHTPARVALPRMVGLTAVLFAMDAALTRYPLIIPDGAHAATVPHNITDKLAALSGIVTLLALVTVPLKRLPRLLTALSAESLVIYVFHLLILFQPTFGLVALMGRQSHSLTVGLLSSAGMMILVCGLTVAWHHRSDKGSWLLGRLRRRTSSPPLVPSGSEG